MIRAALVLAAALVASAASAETPSLVHRPSAPGAHPPLIVLLHGQGADERDMIGMWADLPKEFVVVSPRAPYSNPNGGYRWYRSSPPADRAADIAASAKEIEAIARDAAEKYGADPKRLFVGGFSQGAVMSLEVATRAPGVFRGAASLSGAPPAHAAAGAAFFIAHGTEDARIPFSSGEYARDALTKAGAKVEFHAYPGMGHQTSDAETRDLAAWLARLSGGG